MPFLPILTPTEIKQHESPAHFDDQERTRFFTLPPDLRQAMEHLRTPSSQISFVLQVGYFRSSQRFFGPQSYPADLTFVAAQLALPRPDSLRTPKQTLARYRQTIMEFYGYRQLDANDKEQLAQEITLLVKHLHRPADIFRQTLQKLKSRKLVLPHYHFLASLIARTIKQRKVSLNQIIKKSLSVEQKQ